MSPAARSPGIACLALICSLLLGAAAAPAGAYSWQQWLNPTTAPFIPIPLIDTDPDSGHTIGLLPTLLQTDPHGDIRLILAPSVYKSSYFGWGLGASIYAYPSQDTQWSADGSAEQRVERQAEVKYQVGRERLQPWSLNAWLMYERIGTPRFFGIGNDTSLRDETNYTSEQEMLQLQPGWNINPYLQLGYLLQAENVTVSPGALKGVPSIERRYGPAYGLGTNAMLLNRLLLTYDTRDDLTMPTRGMALTAYAGLASRQGILNASMYSESGVDTRFFLPLDSHTVLALHTALRYLLEAHRLPFWALSTLGGDNSVIGGEQPLRGFGEGRFSDRDSFSFSGELRRTVASLDAMSTHIDLQLAPFVDVGRVFHRPGTDPVGQLHSVAGLGIRGLARPFVVGYVDIGYGSEGAAVFTGINYPF
ncbi:MAG TPA: BamA/TamA family outer membrane protein [Steroidobacteraceae bacterium]|jgi:outer membrane protein assembly factor BamA|nr:BamA/TamA family outer membrane protein [Steroidobacteraceae bacterium]